MMHTEDIFPNRLLSYHRIFIAVNLLESIVRLVLVKRLNLYVQLLSQHLLIRRYAFRKEGHFQAGILRTCL